MLHQKVLGGSGRRLKLQLQDFYEIKMMVCSLHAIVV